MIGLLIASTLYKQNYDRFHCQLQVSSPKSVYTVGDQIELNFDVTGDQEDRIRIYKDRRKSLTLLIRKAAGDSVVFSETDFELPNFPVPVNKDDEIEVVELTPGKPYRLTLRGLIRRSDQGDGIIFDFGEYGHLRKDAFGSFMVGGYWMPINPSPDDSLEDFTNKITIEVREPTSNK